MKHAVLLALFAPAMAFAQTPETEATPETPSDVIAAAGADDWRAIAPENLLVMTLGSGAEVFIELAPDFAPVHVENIRTLARAHWFDGISVNRVQDNYVVQWGDASGEKPLPKGVVEHPPAEYELDQIQYQMNLRGEDRTTDNEESWRESLNNAYYDPSIHNGTLDVEGTRAPDARSGWHNRDAYAEWVEYNGGWPLGMEGTNADAIMWLTHCYGMVGVGRGDNPDTGTGAELYTVIGHAPRHLDRNIALVGRTVEGIEALSSLPRGTGPLGFYEEAEQRVPIASIRLASELPAADRPMFEVMRTDGDIFRRYVTARSNRTGWFIRPAGAVDVCNVNLPIRRVVAEQPDG